MAAELALVSTTFAPLLAAAELRRALVPAIWTTAIACIAMALLLPPYTKDWPRRLTLRYVDDGRATRWESSALTPPLHRAAGFDIKPRVYGEWLRTPARAYAAPAPALHLPAPEVRVVARGGGRLSLLVRSLRGAPRVVLTFRAPSLRAMTIDGVAPPAPGARFYDELAPGWHRVVVTGASEARIDLALRDDTSIDAIVSDTSFGLPAEGASLARARDASNGAPWSDGDTTTVARRVTL